MIRMSSVCCHRPWVWWSCLQVACNTALYLWNKWWLNAKLCLTDAIVMSFWALNLDLLIGHEAMAGRLTLHDNEEREREREILHPCSQPNETTASDSCSALALESLLQRLVQSPSAHCIVLIVLCLHQWGPSCISEIHSCTNRQRSRPNRISDPGGLALTPLRIVWKPMIYVSQYWQWVLTWVMHDPHSMIQGFRVNPQL